MKKIYQEMNRINQLLEDIPAPGTTSHMTGASTAQIAMMIPPDVATVVSDPYGSSESGYGDTSEPEDAFNDIELRLAKRFIELIGGPERARDLVNKCDECEECLGLIDQDNSDSSCIDNVASVMPSEVDLPTSKGMGMSALYNPNATIHPFS